MPQFVEPRVVRLSWRPPTDAFGAEVGAWVERLKKRLGLITDVAGRSIKLQDMNQAGVDKAALREGPWTDFVAVFTVDYCATCAEEGPTSEIHEARLRHDEPDHLLWVVRLEEGDPAAFKVGDVFPWRDAPRWRVLPEPDAPPLSTARETLDRDLQSRCIEHLRKISPSPAADDSATPGG